MYTRDHFTEDETRIYIAEIVVALEQLHRLGIVYRDIKLENILLDRDGHILLTDFGLSKEFKPRELAHKARTYSFCGTLEYMAPEVVRGGSNGHTMAVDWWSVGVLAYELLTGASPFSTESTDERKSHQEITKKILKSEIAIPQDLSTHCQDFLARLLARDPKRRLGGGPRDAEEVKEHPFFTQAPPPFTWEALLEKRLTPPFVPTLACETDTCNFSEEFTKQSTAQDSPAAEPKPAFARVFDVSHF